MVIWSPYTLQLILNFRSSERGKKRERSDSSANLVNIPAAKMARALGTGNAEAEAAFLQHKLGKKEKKSSKWIKIVFFPFFNINIIAIIIHTLNKSWINLNIYLYIF